jgi:hypothetical protein
VELFWLRMRQFDCFEEGEVVVYWLEIYALIVAVAFAVAGLFILAGFVWCELEDWFRRGANPPRGIPVAITTSISTK